MNDLERTLCEDAVKKWGTGTQLIMVIEECAELQKAVTKLLRNKGSAQDIIEEAVDVEWMLKQLEVMYSFPDAWSLMRQKKLDHLIALLKERREVI